jgi:hypothetical protein
VVVVVVVLLILLSCFLNSHHMSVVVVGCSPRDFPTADYIKAHEDLYKDENDDASLKSIVRGGGICQSDTDCHGDTQSEEAAELETKSDFVAFVKQDNIRVTSDRLSSAVRNHCSMPPTADGVSHANRTGVCKCTALFTGSHCRAQLGFDAITYTYNDNDIVFGDLPSIANGLSVGVFVSVAAVSFTILVAYVYSNP